jgi:hypothetical protein
MDDALGLLNLLDGRQHQRILRDIAWDEARLGPWLRYLHLRRNSRLFHNNTLHEQSGAIFTVYGTKARWECRVGQGRHHDSVSL